VFSFLGLLFSQGAQEETGGFYIRFCFVNFVKLYSQCSVNDLKEISQRIREFGHSGKLPPEESATVSEKHQRYFKTSFLNMYIRCLFSLACNRTEEITRKYC
jgi:hypothetical protein